MAKKFKKKPEKINEQKILAEQEKIEKHKNELRELEKKANKKLAIILSSVSSSVLLILVIVFCSVFFSIKKPTYPKLINDFDFLASNVKIEEIKLNDDKVFVFDRIRLVFTELPERKNYLEKKQINVATDLVTNKFYSIELRLDFNGGNQNLHANVVQTDPTPENSSAFTFTFNAPNGEFTEEFFIIMKNNQIIKVGVSS